MADSSQAIIKTELFVSAVKADPPNKKDGQYGIF